MKDALQIRGYTLHMRSISVFLLLGIASTALCSAQTMFRGDARHTGVTQEKGPATLHGIKWSFTTGGRSLASPVLDQGTLFIGSDDRSLYALDAANGKLRWKFVTSGPVRSTAAVDSGTVYFGSYDGQFYAVSAEKGELRWKFSTGGERRFEAKGLHGSTPSTQTISDPWDCYQSSPVVAEGHVIFGSGDRQVYALETKTGALAWKFATGDVVHASPAFADGRVFVGSWDSRLYALDVKTGRELWHFQAGLDPKYHNQIGFQSSPAVVDGVVYVGCRDAKLYALDAATGKEKWRFDNSGSWVITSPAVANGNVIFATSDTAKIHILDTSTGTLKRTLSAGAYVFSSPTLSGSVAYIGVINGSLLAFDWEKGSLLWEFQTASARENKLQVLNPDRTLNQANLFPNEYFDQNAFGLDRLFSIGSIMSTPLVSGGLVYISSTDGNVYAIE